MISFRIFDRHYLTQYDDTGMLCLTDKKDGWVRFDYAFDPQEKTITDFVEFPLFDDDGEFIAKATKVNFSDGSWVYCCNSFEWFTNNVIPEYIEYFKNKDTDSQ